MLYGTIGSLQRRRTRTKTHLGDLALSALVLSSHNQDLVVLSDGERSGGVLLSELLAQRRRHDLSLEAGRSGEVSLPGLSSVGSESYEVSVGLEI